MFVSEWLLYVYTGYFILINVWGLPLASCILIIFSLLKYHRVDFLTIMVIVASAFIINLPSYIKVDDYQVIKIKENYAIASNVFNEKVIIYNQKLNYFTKIKVTKTQDIYSKQNPLIFNFSSFLKDNRVSFEALEFQIIKEVDNLPKYIRNKLETLSVTKQDYLLKYLYNEKSDDLLTTLFISNGLAFRYLINHFCLLALLFIDKKYLKYIRLFLISLFYFCFPFITTIFIHLLLQVISMFEKQASKRIFYLACFCFVFDYSLLINPSFLFLFMMNFGDFINIKTDYLNKKLYLLFSQLIIFNKANLLSLVAFKFLSFLMGFTLFIAVFNGLFIDGVFIYWQNILVFFDNILEVFMLNTKASIITLLIFVILITSKDYILKALRPLIILLIQFQQFFNPLTTITILDIGNGDCAVVSLPFNRGNYLIDAGENFQKTNAKRIILPYLKAQGIFYLDGLIITHQDHDHFGAVREILENIYVKELIYSDKTIEKDGLKIININNPDKRIAPDNASSLVSLICINRTNIVFLADIDKARERAIINEYDLSNFDILKLAHHGSNTSTSDELLSSANWKLALISSGYKNRYNHPAKEVIESLSNYQIPYLNTAEKGYIQLINVFGINFIKTSDNKFVIIYTS